MRAVATELGADNDLLFVPHLLPVARGILATITVPLKDELEDSLEIWKTAVCRASSLWRSLRKHQRLRDVVRRKSCRVIATEGKRGTGSRRCRHRNRGDRQPREGRGGPGAAERQPDARAERANGIARMIRVIKIGGRAQSSPLFDEHDCFSVE